MRKLLFLACLALMMLGTASCKFLFKKTVVEKIHDVKILAINPDKTELEVAISVKNPNCYKLVVNSMEINLLNREREKIGTARLLKKVEIPKKKSNALNFLISLDTRPAVRMLNHSEQKLFMYLGGEGVGRVMGVNKRFEFEEPYELDFKSKLQDVMAGFDAKGQDIFVLKRSYVEKVGLAETSLKIDFIIMNPYGLKFTLQGFPAAIRIGGKEVGKGNLLEPLAFDETVYSREGSMVFKVSNWKSIVGAVKGALQGEISYEVGGDVDISGYGMRFTRPFDYDGTISVNLSEILLN